MKTLIAVRHAKSSWNHRDLKDFDRPLNSRGTRDAPVMAARIRSCGTIPQLIYSSPALRAKTTAELIAAGIGTPTSDIRFDDRIYAAGLAELIGVMRRIDDSISAGMLIGHNPGMTELVITLTGRDIDSLPTCAVIHINLDVSTWADTGVGCGQLVSYEYPKMFVD